MNNTEETLDFEQKHKEDLQRLRGFREGIIFITGFSYIGIYKTAVISCTFCTSTTITSLEMKLILFM